MVKFKSYWSSQRIVYKRVSKWEYDEFDEFKWKISVKSYQLICWNIKNIQIFY